MELNNYQYEAGKFAIYPKEAEILYPLFGLVSEVGELAGHLKKGIRGDFDNTSETDSQKFDALIKAELGDVLWYLAKLSEDCGFTLEEVAEYNITKLTLRKANDTLKGSGDFR